MPFIPARRLQTRLLVWTSLILIVLTAGAFEVRTRIAARMIEQDLRERTNNALEAVGRTLQLRAGGVSRNLLEERLREFVDVAPTVARVDIVETRSGKLRMVASSADSGNLLLDKEPKTAEAFVRMADSQRELITARRIANSPYTVVAVTRLGSLDQFVFINRIWIGVFTIALAGPSIFLIHFMFRRTVSKRFEEMLESIRRVKDGKVEERIPEDKEDEIGIIARAFNSLLDQVRSFNDELQLQVAQATESLNRRNQALEETTRQLVAMQKLLSRSERLSTIGQMAATFAHEIGSPLSSVSAHVQLLLEDPHLSAEERETLVIVRQQIHSMVQIVNDLLRTARRGPEDFVPVDINEILGSVLRLVNPKLRSQQIEVQAELNPVPHVRGYSLYLQEAFLNVINNASDAMPTGGLLDVRLWFESDANQVHIRIADTGPGIDSSILESVFEHFVTTKSMGNGTGLGLPIVKEIVDQHHGFVYLAPANDHGTAMHIVFPADVSIRSDV